MALLSEAVTSAAKLVQFQHTRLSKLRLTYFKEKIIDTCYLLQKRNQSILSKGD